MLQTLLLAIFFGALLLLAVGGALYFWLAFNDVEMSAHGIFALTLGVGVSLALGIGLMRLVYFSNRKGFD